ncbi:MAG TPA: serine dehydratase [Bacteroidales bacterium]|nr:serine dehydratase [Bacteroidales bacterium]
MSKSLSQVPGKSELLSVQLLIKPYINTTPILTCKTFNSLLDTSIFFKCENFQKGGAFKFRGASHAISCLDSLDAKKGVCTHSSGNHAQALALAARLRGIQAHIVMPNTSSKVKIEAVKGYGGKITFCNPTLAAREETLSQVQQETGAIFIHPFNDYNIIAGQATACMELIAEHPDLDFIIAPVGGGGLLSGTILATKYFSPSTKVIAAEPEQANDAFQSFNLGKFVPSLNPKTIADGLLTSLGDKTWPIIKNGVSIVLTAKEDTIISAMKLIWERMKIVVEPSGVLPLAVMMENESFFRNKKVGLILSGGNVDLNRLPWLSSQPNSR